MVSALDVAWFFVLKGQGDPSVTQLKLQKLVYYAQGFHLAMFDEPLFNEEIEAWDYGPVATELREVHKDRGAESILPTEEPFGGPIEDEETEAFLENIFHLFGRYTAGQLVHLTHQEPTWKAAYSSPNKIIGKGSMKAYFSTRLNEVMPTSFVDVHLLDGRTEKISVDDLQDFLIRNWDNLVTEREENCPPLYLA